MNEEIRNRINQGLGGNLAEELNGLGANIDGIKMSEFLTELRRNFEGSNEEKKQAFKALIGDGVAENEVTDQHRIYRAILVQYFLEKEDNKSVNEILSDQPNRDLQAEDSNPSTPKEYFFKYLKEEQDLKKEQDLKEEQAATTIQKMFRGHSVRKKQSQEKEERERQEEAGRKGITTFQKTLRGVRARENLAAFRGDEAADSGKETGKAGIVAAYLRGLDGYFNEKADNKDDAKGKWEKFSEDQAERERLIKKVLLDASALPSRFLDSLRDFYDIWERKKTNQVSFGEEIIYNLAKKDLPKLENIFDLIEKDEDLKKLYSGGRRSKNKLSEDVAPTQELVEEELLKSLRQIVKWVGVNGVETFERGIEAAKRSVEAFERDIEELRKSLEDNRKTIEDSEGKKKELEVKIAELIKQISENQEKNSEATKQLLEQKEKAEKEKEGAKKQIENLTAEQQKIQEQLESAPESLLGGAGPATSSQHTVPLATKFPTVESGAEELKKSLEDNRKTIESLEGKKKELEAEIVELNKQIPEIQVKNSEAIAQLSKKKEEAEKEKEEAEKEKEKAEKEKEKAQEQIKNLTAEQQKIQKLKLALESLLGGVGPAASSSGVPLTPAASSSGVPLTPAASSSAASAPLTTTPVLTKLELDAAIAELKVKLDESEAKRVAEAKQHTENLVATETSLKAGLDGMLASLTSENKSLMEKMRQQSEESKKKARESLDSEALRKFGAEGVLRDNLIQNVIGGAAGAALTSYGEPIFSYSGIETGNLLTAHANAAFDKWAGGDRGENSTYTSFTGKQRNPLISIAKLENRAVPGGDVPIYCVVKVDHEGVGQTFISEATFRREIDAPLAKMHAEATQFAKEWFQNDGIPDLEYLLGNRVAADPSEEKLIKKIYEKVSKENLAAAELEADKALADRYRAIIEQISAHGLEEEKEFRLDLLNKGEFEKLRNSLVNDAGGFREDLFLASGVGNYFAVQWNNLNFIRNGDAAGRPGIIELMQRYSEQNYPIILKVLEEEDQRLDAVIKNKYLTLVAQGEADFVKGKHQKIIDLMIDSPTKEDLKRQSESNPDDALKKLFDKDSSGQFLHQFIFKSSEAASIVDEYNVLVDPTRSPAATAEEKKEFCEKALAAIDTSRPTKTQMQELLNNGGDVLAELFDGLNPKHAGLFTKINSSGALKDGEREALILVSSSFNSSEKANHVKVFIRGLDPAALEQAKRADLQQAIYRIKNYPAQIANGNTKDMNIDGLITRVLKGNNLIDKVAEASANKFAAVYNESFLANKAEIAKIRTQEGATLNSEEKSRMLEKSSDLKSVLNLKFGSPIFDGTAFLRPSNNQFSVMFNGDFGVAGGGSSGFTQDIAYIPVPGGHKAFMRARVCTSDNLQARTRKGKDGNDETYYVLPVYKKGNLDYEEHRVGDVVMDYDTVFHLTKKQDGTPKYEPVSLRSFSESAFQGAAKTFNVVKGAATLFVPSFLKPANVDSSIKGEREFGKREFLEICEAVKNMEILVGSSGRDGEERAFATMAKGEVINHTAGRRTYFKMITGRDNSVRVSDRAVFAKDGEKLEFKFDKNGDVQGGFSDQSINIGDGSNYKGSSRFVDSKYLKIPGVDLELFGKVSVISHQVDTTEGTDKAGDVFLSSNIFYKILRNGKEEMVPVFENNQVTEEFKTHLLNKTSTIKHEEISQKLESMQNKFVESANIFVTIKPNTEPFDHTATIGDSGWKMNVEKYEAKAHESVIEVQVGRIGTASSALKMDLLQALASKHVDEALNSLKAFNPTPTEQEKSDARELKDQNLKNGLNEARNGIEAASKKEIANLDKGIFKTPSKSFVLREKEAKSLPEIITIKKFSRLSHAGRAQSREKNNIKTALEDTNGDRYR